MKRPLALLLLAAAPLSAQVQQAQPVDPALQADPANDMFQRGKNLYDQGRSAPTPESRTEALMAAAAVFNQYISQFPNHQNTEPAWLYMGQSLYLSGRVDEGKRAFQTMITKFNHGGWVGAAAYTLAQDFYNKKDYASAAPLFQKCAENPPRPEDRARGYFFSATSYRNLGNQDRVAGDLYRKVIDDPAAGSYVAQSKFGLGLLYLKTGKHSDALPLFESVVTSDASPAVRGEAALKAALSAIKLNKPELADKYLKLIAITPGMEDSRADAVGLLMENAFSHKDYAGVLDAYRKSALESADTIEGPGDIKRVQDERKAQRLMLAGRSLFQLKKVSDALTLFRQVEHSVPIQDDLAYQAAYYRLLCFYEINGENLPDQVDAFLQLYRKSHATDPKIHTSMLMKAEALFTKAKFDKAAEVYNEIDVSLVPESNRSELLYKRGWSLAEAGDPQGAIRSLSKFIADYPSDKLAPKALAKRATCYVATGEGPKAIEDFDKLSSSGDTEFVALAWLESARLRRKENNIADMIVRYRNLITKGGTLSKKLEAEGNYFIGWGMAKNNDIKGSVPFLEKARQLDPETYGEHAGLLLALGYFTTQNLDKLSEEIDRAIEKQYASNLPDQTLNWAGMQSYYAGKYAAASRYLDRVANPDEPRETPKETWRYLGKARLENGKAEDALKAIENVLAVEDNGQLKADALLDKARALFNLNRDADARKSADQAADLHPEGRTGAGVRILNGDLKMRAGDADGAVGAYIAVVQIVEDRDLKPLAIWKLTNALDKKGDHAGADKYREQLKKEFPNWQAPKAF